jgi:hypothetical protein
VIDPDHPPRWWTASEANEALPRVADAISRAQGNLSEHAERVATAAVGNGHANAEDALVTFPEVVIELEQEGIVLRDFRTGLVDFPAQAPNGRGYWLCWLSGEPEVAWWHWPEDGFAGRKPLTEPPS